MSPSNITGQFKCVYCGSNSVLIQTLTRRRKANSLSIGLNDLGISFNAEDDINVIQAPLRIECDACGRRYEMVALDSENKEFISTLLDRIEYDMELANQMLDYGISSADDIKNGAEAIVIPLNYKNRVRKWVSKKVSPRVGYEFHILFHKNGEKFYLAIYVNKEMRKITATQVIKV